MADPDKVKWQMLLPTCVRQVRSLICMCSYYRMYIPNFSTVLQPLIRLTKKFAKFEWSKECQAAFDFLKENLTTVPVLACWDTSKPYILYTHASNDYIGACLCQEWDIQGEMTSDESNEKPTICHINLQLHRPNWPTIEKEAFAIFYSLQKLDSIWMTVNLLSEQITNLSSIS